MAKLTFPDRLALQQRLSGTDPLYLDRHATASPTADGFAVGITADGQTLTATYTEPGVWTLLAEGSAPGERVVLPEPIITRANRLMSADGPSVKRDWRTKTHVLQAAPRKVLPLHAGQPVSAVHSASGWQASMGASAPSAAVPTVAPSAPSVAPDAAQPAPSPQAKTREPGIVLPAVYQGKVVLSKANQAKWENARRAQRSGWPTLVAFIGPSGAAKTHAVHALSAAEGMETWKWDCSGMEDPQDWFGTVVVRDGRTVFMPSLLLRGLTEPGKRTVLLDEVNRSALRALNAMLPVLDGSGTFVVPQTGEAHRQNPEVQIVVTANIGSGFIGTEPLDHAVVTRVGAWIEMEHLDEKREKALLLQRVPNLSDYDAGNLAALGALIRKSAESGAHPPVSTRQMLNAAWQIALGGEAKTVVEATILDGYLSEGGTASERSKVRTHVEGIMWSEPKPGREASAEPIREGQTCQTPDCGHPAVEHGILDGTVSAQAYCRRGGCPCMTFTAVQS